jgi:hypothetical protein
MKSSRRRFLQSTLAAPFAASLGPTGYHWVRVLDAAPGQMQFENPHLIRYDASCFTVNDRDTFIFSGTLHYPRCPKSLWRDRLTKFKYAGFNTIETYVFWNYHEPEEGKANLADFEDFIKLVHELGFYMIVRPGPYVCAEWERGGFPDWVAAKRFTLRSNDPQSIQTSQHWFSQVLPVIQRHQVTLQGPIIMVQVENEYDFSPPMPDADKRAYIAALARMVWMAGIDVPVITCWTKQARENSYPEMARIMDTCNFYPRWNIVKELVPGLAKLRKEEPASPVGITELQGGWFSQFGGKLSVDQPGVNGAQLNMVTKTAIEQGVTYFNYYMGFGGTNFDWAAKTITTTYDYAAPIREPGGLWEKYYVARGICRSLRMYGEMLTRAQVMAGSESTNPNVSVSERSFVKSGMVFVRENANATQRFKMSFADPHSPTHRRITVPREGEMEIGAREMKMFPLQVEITGGRLCYSTAEVLAHGHNWDRAFLILYDEPGRLAEISIATENEPKIEGDTVYRYWDQDYESSVFGVRFDQKEKMLLHNEIVQVILVPRERALRTCLAQFPANVLLGSEDEKKPEDVPLITDCYRLVETGSHGHRFWADLEFLPGEHDVLTLLPPVPAKCHVDGVLTDFQYDREWRSTRLHLTTPPVPVQPVDLPEGRAWVDTFDPGTNDFLSFPLRPLEESAPAPYGYVIYRALFPLSSQAKMFIRAFTDDFKKVFINRKLVAEASNANKEVEFDLSHYATPGATTLDISYEAFGASNGGKELGDLKGIESVRIGSDAQSAKAFDGLQIQRSRAPMRGREVDPAYGAKSWQPASYKPSGSSGGLVPAFTWYRTEFTLPGAPNEWTVPWKLAFEADRDALLYLNGRFLGRYSILGPQKEFYLPEPYLASSGTKNVLTFVLAYTDSPQHVRTLRAEPYAEFSVRRTRVEFEY